MAVSHILSYTACLESPLSVPNETVLGMTATLGYARVTTTGQDLDVQLATLTAAGVDAKRVFTDKLSGAATYDREHARAHQYCHEPRALSGWAQLVVSRRHMNRAAVYARANARQTGSCCACSARSRFAPASRSVPLATPLPIGQPGGLATH